MGLFRSGRAMSAPVASISGTGNRGIDYRLAPINQRQTSISAGIMMAWPRAIGGAAWPEAP
ncbi:hypothetical protein MMOR_03350 [Mycolicibacterium moriokaense]|uniref:Uncharacterized protein n=1 Tax=Mycolicibacterium moriokaense TaxID=39691 RepID=A0AAD1H6N2_9MYCO|nr:hypothetical protein MMOR_03350 [Mycolicibacterium moriokaense]